MKLCDLAKAIENNRDNYIEFYGKKNKTKKYFYEFYQDVLKVIKTIRTDDRKQGSYIGIQGKNCYEWLVVDLACFLAGYVLVAFPENFSQEQIYNYVSKWNIDLLYCEKQPEHKEQLPCEIRVLEEIQDYPLVEGEIRLPNLTKNRVFTVVFSSGTTGIPKAMGVRQESIEKTILTSVPYFDFSHNDKNLCFLPLSVFTSRLYIYSGLLLGFHLAVTIPELVLPALRIYQPTIMQGVPYFFENVANIFLIKLEGSMVARILYKGYLLGKRFHISILKKKIQPILYKGFDQTFGGKMKILITGTAPISESTLKVYEDAGISLFESYGLNETGVLTLNYPDSCRVGSVGKVLPQYEVVIDEQSQVLVKSDYFWTNGYLEEENNHKFQVNEKGYCETGDTGYFDKDGFLFLTGRCVDTITLKNGIKVNPLEIEKLLNAFAPIKQSLIYSKDLKRISGIIVKNNPKLTKKELENCVNLVNQKLDTNKQIIDVIIAQEDFTIENGMLTSNLKMNRKEIIKKYG